MTHSVEPKPELNSYNYHSTWDSREPYRKGEYYPEEFYYQRDGPESMTSTPPKQ